MEEDEKFKKPKKARTDKEILEEARERLKLCIDDYAEERKKQKDDLLFSTLEQWPDHIRAEREGDPNGARPCLTIDQINQYIVQVVNDMRQNRPAVKTRPVDEGADIATAEVFQGIIRQIEDQSVAQVAYATAGESAVRVGEGYFRFITEYEDEKSFDQVIRIKKVPDMFCVYLGHHIMPDGSDAEYGFIFEDMLLESFKRTWPKAKYHSTDFSELEDSSYWAEEGKIRVCEYFYFEYETAKLIFTADGRAMLQKEYDELQEPKPEITDSRETRTRSVKWCKLTGVEILEKRDWAGKYIPIVKVIGKEAWVDGRRCSWGLVRPAKDSLRMYNYMASTIVEKIALSPKTPFIGAAGQFEGHEEKWANANRVNYAYLEYEPKSVDGLSVPPPQRQPPAPIEVAMYQFLQTAREDVQASLGMFKASLGKEQPNQSGKAILALTRESDTGTFHFNDNQSISIQHGGRIMVDLIPKIYDTPRIVKILGEDGKVNSAQLDPQQPMSNRQIPDQQGKIKNIYNLNVGTYDVTVTVGPSYNTKRAEAATLFTDLGNTAKDPASATIMRYLAVKNSDVPGADQAAGMLEKLLPPGVMKQEGQPDIPPEVHQKMQQMQQLIQAMGQENQELKSDAQVKMAKVQVDGQAQDKKITADAQAQDRKIMADHDAKMKELDAGKVIQDRELQLLKEKNDAEIALKRAMAVADNEIQQQKTENEKVQKQDELAFEKQCQQQEQDEKALPDIAKTIEEGFAKSMETMAKLLEESMKLNREVLEAVSAPKDITLKRDSEGRPVGASIRVLN